LQGTNGVFEVEVKGIIIGVYVVIQGIPGVVAMKSGSFHCLTCKKNFCDHVRHINRMNEDETINSTVIERLISSCQRPPTSVNNRKRHSVFSKKPISFTTTEHMAKALRKLCTASELSSLSPSVSVACQCGGNGYVSSVLYKEADLITQTCLGKVQGIGLFLLLHNMNIFSLMLLLNVRKHQEPRNTCGVM
jgi:hypothetical protein